MRRDLNVEQAMFYRAAELVEVGYCKDVVARNADGYSVPCNDPSAVAWCMIGAVCKASLETGGRYPDDLGRWIDWNNHPNRTADEVAAKLRELGDRSC